jgi:hypothetical protein
MERSLVEAFNPSQTRKLHGKYFYVCVLALVTGIFIFTIRALSKSAFRIGIFLSLSLLASFVSSCAAAAPTAKEFLARCCLVFSQLIKIS